DDCCCCRSCHKLYDSDSAPNLTAAPAERETPDTWHLTPKTCLYHSDAAAAPLTTSIISFVMAAWRTRFMYSVNVLIMSLALEVAASMRSEEHTSELQSPDHL